MKKQFKITYKFAIFDIQKGGESNVLFYAEDEKDARVKFLNWCVGSDVHRRIINIVPV